MRVGEALVAMLDRQSLDGAAWAALALGSGIGIWFALPFEPPLWLYGALLAAPVIVRVRGLCFVTLFLCAGFCLAGMRAHVVQAPRLEGPYYGPVIGTLVEIDRGSAGQMRLTLAEVQLLGVAVQRVRVTLSGNQQGFDTRVGARLMTTARLVPPSGPAEPHGFDFRLFAYFERLGGVGATAVPVMTLEHAPEGSSIAGLRQRLSGRIGSAIEGDAGGFVAAVLTGDRSGLSPQADDAMRAANLYHLVSISGTHMALLAAFVFGLIRTSIALFPALAVRVDGRKWAAALALPIAFFYLLLAGRDVATERAFIMVAVGLGAIMLDRQALSVQSVAIAALIVLALRPEALMNVGFQMSFAAALGLSLGMGHVLRLSLPRPVQLLLAALVASAIAGMATAPFAAAHFGRVPHYGLLANLLASPIMAFVIMPMGIIAPIFGLVQLEALPLAVAGWGAEQMLQIAYFIEAMPMAVSGVKAPPPIVMPLLASGALFAILWRGKLRWGALVIAIFALFVWVLSDRPAVIVSADGAAVGVMGPEGRVFSKPRGAGYAAATWLERDGDLTSQSEASRRSGFEQHFYAPLRLKHVFGRDEISALRGCEGAKIMIVAGVSPSLEGCDLWDRPRLQAAGGIVIWPDGRVEPILKPAVRLWQ